MDIYHQIKQALLNHSTPERAKTMQRFFKTGKGEYGEGDLFHGVSVPQQRIIAKSFQGSTEASDIICLLDSVYHEERLTGVFILVDKFKKACRTKNEEPWVKLYLSKTDRINNWDLVDSSAHLILGKWLEDKDRSIQIGRAHV